MTDASPTIGAAVYDKLNFNFINDIAPIIYILRAPFLMVINPAVPAKTVPEFLAYAKSNSDKINMASAGNGTPPHLTGELFKMMTGLKLVHVPYRGHGMAQLVAKNRELLPEKSQNYRTAILPGIPAVKMCRQRAQGRTCQPYCPKGQYRLELVPNNNKSVMRFQ